METYKNFLLGLLSMFIAALCTIVISNHVATQRHEDKINELAKAQESVVEVKNRLSVAQTNIGWLERDNQQIFSELDKIRDHLLNDKQKK